MSDSPEVEFSLVMPCLNERETLEICIQKAASFFAERRIRAEIIVADNGSDDGSQALAESLGVRVVAVAQKGYGAALLGGVKAALGTYVIMGDADDSYDFSRLDNFVDELREGAELVMGNRFKGGIEKGAMPWLHRYLGNPVLSFFGRLFFNISISDFHCGLRGFKREAILNLGLVCTGMEFASEMVVKSSISRLSIVEVPTTLSPDGRTRSPHLRSWRDGWRHLRFLLLYSPKWLFFYPGLLLLFMGVGLMALIKKQVLFIGEVGFDIHTMLYAGAATIVGLQLLIFAVQVKYIGMMSGLLRESDMLKKLAKHTTLERGMAIGGLVVLAGFVFSVLAFFGWEGSNFGRLDPREMMRDVIPAVVMIIGGMQLVFSAFYLSALKFYEISKNNGS